MKRRYHYEWLAYQSNLCVGYRELYRNISKTMCCYMTSKVARDFYIKKVRVYD